MKKSLFLVVFFYSFNLFASPSAEIHALEFASYEKCKAVSAVMHNLAKAYVGLEDNSCETDDQCSTTAGLQMCGYRAVSKVTAMKWDLYYKSQSYYELSRESTCPIPSCAQMPPHSIKCVAKTCSIVFDN